MLCLLLILSVKPDDDIRTYIHTYMRTLVVWIAGISWVSVPQRLTSHRADTVMMVGESPPFLLETLGASFPNVVSVDLVILLSSFLSQLLCPIPIQLC